MTAYPKSMLEDVLPRLETRPSRVYVAASLRAQNKALHAAFLLQQNRFVVTSRWLGSQHDDESDSPWHEMIKKNRQCAEENIADLEKADTLLVLCDKPSTTGGLHFELGWWVGRGRGNVVLVGGDRTNVFHWLRSPEIRWTLAVETAVKFLQREREGRFAADDPQAASESEESEVLF